MSYVLVVLTLVVAACGGGNDNRVFAPGDAATAPGSGGVLVDSAGGVVEVTAGGGEANGARLVVPEGALEDAALIEVTAQSNRPGPLEANSAVVTALTDYALTEGESAGLHPILTPIAILASATPVGPEFTLEPDGAQFALPVSLEIPLAMAPVGQDETLVVLVESSDGTVEVVAGVQITEDRVLVPLDHFSVVKLLSIPLNVLGVALGGLDVDAARHAAQLVGPHATGVSREVLASQCAQRGSISFDTDRMPSYFELLNNLARQEGEIGGVSFDQLFALRGWLLDIGRAGNPAVSPARIYEQALQIAAGDAFQALVISHEVLRDDRFDKRFDQLVTDVRGDSTDEVGARYHMFGTALYGFWTEYQRALPNLTSGLVVTAETAAAWEEAYVSGDIDTDPGEFVVDLVGAQMGRDLFNALQENPLVRLAAGNDPCAQFTIGAIGDAAGSDENSPESLNETDLPITFSGIGTHEKSLYRSATNDGFVCSIETVMVLVLQPGGTVQFSHADGVRLAIAGDTHTCEPIAGNAWSGTFDLEAGTFTIPAPAPLDVWTFDGVFNSATAAADVEWVSTAGTSDSYIDDTGVLKFSLDRQD